ncbi:glycoside hydrolase family 43 protein, partial [Akkermansia sp.]
MTNIIKPLLSLLLFCGAAVLSAADTPVKHTSFKPGEIWTDNNGVHINAHGGGILYDKGTYYWYGEHKVEGDAGNYAQVGVHCYSSKDLYNWKDEGIALKVVEGDNSHPIAKGCILERPKVVYNKKTKKYVMWFHLELKGKGYGAAYAGVATATKPTGPFTFLKAGRVNPGKWPANMDKKDQTMKTFKGVPALTSSALPEGVRSEDMFKKDFEKGQMSRDMTIFVDDDGKAYHIYSSEENSTTHIAELTPDYTG